MADVNKSKIQQAFADASAGYDGVADLQRTTGKALLKFARQPITGSILDLGCGTGFISVELLSYVSIERRFALDLAMPMLIAARDKLRTQNVDYICADAERLPLAAGCLDGVISNLALQWCRDLAGVFTGIEHALKPQGQLLFSTFGPQTLFELKNAWAKVDSYRHVNDFYPAEDIRRLLVSAGFGHVDIQSQIMNVNYQTVFTLLKELKQLGAHWVMSGRNPHLTSKSRLMKMVGEYERLLDADGIPASFEVILVRAEKVNA